MPRVCVVKRNFDDWRKVNLHVLHFPLPTKWGGFMMMNHPVKVTIPPPEFTIFFPKKKVPGLKRKIIFQPAFFKGELLVFRVVIT